MQVKSYKQFYIVANNNGKIDIVHKITGKMRVVKSEHAAKWRATNYQTKINKLAF